MPKGLSDMKLHLDRAAFEVIIDDVSEKYGLRRDVSEKDYYVTLLLKELADKENQAYAYFKGGTALYKALKSIRRFSEDIDLTVYVEDCPSASQAQKRLEKATLKFDSLKKGKTLENLRGSINCEYLYDSLFSLDTEDSLQRFGRVKIESTSFTVSEPTVGITIAPHIYELADDEQKRIIRDVYDVKPFEIKTISLERIFIDKIFAAQFYFERKDFYDMAKHIYDLTVLLDNKQIKEFLKDKNAVSKTVEYNRREELNRKGGIDSEVKVSDFEFFKSFNIDGKFEAALNNMQRIYVFSEDDKVSKEKVFLSLSMLSDIVRDIGI